MLKIREKIGRRWLFSGSWDKTIIIWNISEDINISLKRISLGNQARCIQITHFRELLVTGSFEGKLSFWSFNNLERCSLISN